MAQFRLTNQFAKDLKLCLNKSPEAAIHPLDDWIVDIFRVERKKIALVTHAHVGGIPCSIHNYSI